MFLIRLGPWYTNPEYICIKVAPDAIFSFAELIELIPPTPIMGIFFCKYCDNIETTWVLFFWSGNPLKPPVCKLFFKPDINEWSNVVFVAITASILYLINCFEMWINSFIERSGEILIAIGTYLKYFLCSFFCFFLYYIINLEKDLHIVNILN